MNGIAIVVGLSLVPIYITDQNKRSRGGDLDEEELERVHFWPANQFAGWLAR